MLLPLLLLSLFNSPVFSAPINPGSVTKDVALNYLTTYGYYDPVPAPKLMADPQQIRSMLNHQFKLAVKKFQEYAGIPVTGNLDKTTKRFMARKRCGIPDIKGLQKDAYVFKWDKSDLKWTVDQYSRAQDISEGTTRRAIGQALAVWQDSIPLNFVEVAPNSNADIHVRFAAKEHDDQYPFDGPGGVLAHAMFPPDGRLHFDDDEKWVYMDAEKLKSYENTDLIAVAIHELGHTLGLGHSDQESAIMSPFYHEHTAGQNEYEIPHLEEDDIRRIQQIYGKRSEGFRPETTSPTAVITSTESFATTETQRRVVGVEGGNPDPNDGSWSGNSNQPCPTEIDDAAKSVNGATYVFAGSTVWELQRQRLQTPRPITVVFPGGPERVTAAANNPRTELMLLFNERTVYAYLWDASSGSFKLQKDFPKTLSDLVTFVPAAAFEWRDGNIVLISGDTFATYDEHWNMPTTVQKTALYFPDFPSDVIAAVPVGQPGNLLLMTPAGAYSYNMNDQTLNNRDALPLQQFAACS